MRPLFIGEAPSHSTSRRGAAALVGLTGERLARWAGLSRAEFRQRADCVNLFDQLPERWSQREAAVMALGLWAAHRHETRTMVLVGAKVARAFHLPSLPPYVAHQTSGPSLVMVPHPSGRNRHWNDPANVVRMTSFLLGLLGDAQRPGVPLQLLLEVRG